MSIKAAGSPWRGEKGYGEEGGPLAAFATSGSPICDDNECVSCGCFEDLDMCFPVDLKIRRTSWWAWPHQVSLLTVEFPPAGGRRGHQEDVTHHH